MRETWGGLAAAALVLAGCGSGATPEGLARALADEGVALDDHTSPQRYLEVVENMCDSAGDYNPGTLIALADEGNAEALERMVVGMNYACPGKGDDLALMVDAVG